MLVSGAVPRVLRRFAAKFPSRVGRCLRPLVFFSSKSIPAVPASVPYLQKICSRCSKPNNENAKFCSGCSHPLTQADIFTTPKNVFLEVVRGQSTTHNIRFRSDKMICFDDKYPISNNHILVIPNQDEDTMSSGFLRDISCLREQHIPLIREMYDCGMRELVRRYYEEPAKRVAQLIELYKQKKHLLATTASAASPSTSHISSRPPLASASFSTLAPTPTPPPLSLHKPPTDPIAVRRMLKELAVVGYNFPGSVPHLHLHLVLPPFTHEKVFCYPRWHGHAKVLSDLRSFGFVKLYRFHPNDKEGPAERERAVRLSRLLESEKQYLANYRKGASGKAPQKPVSSGSIVGGSEALSGARVSVVHVASGSSLKHGMKC